MAVPVQIVIADLRLYSHPQLEHELLPKLDGAERARYFAFAHTRRRHVWLAGRALSLAALSRQFGKTEPSRLWTDQAGAPHYGDDTVRISLSHSGNQIAAAIGDVPVGVDIEELRPRQLLQHARRIFSASEVAQLRKLHATQRTDAFYALWTLKEAACKAAGLSLWDGLRNACFDLAERSFRVHAPFPTGGWQLASARLEPGWRLAVVLHDAAEPLPPSCRRLTAAQGWQPQPVSTWTVFQAR